MDESETQSGPEVEQACKEPWVQTAAEPQLGQWRGAPKSAAETSAIGAPSNVT